MCIRLSLSLKRHSYTSHVKEEKQFKYVYQTVIVT